MLESWVPGVLNLLDLSFLGYIMEIMELILQYILYELK